MFQMIVDLKDFDEHIIDIYFNYFAYMIYEHFID